VIKLLPEYANDPYVNREMIRVVVKNAKATTSLKPIVFVIETWADAFKDPRDALYRRVEKAKLAAGIEPGDWEVSFESSFPNCRPYMYEDEA
jgi:hypothetical protein